MHPTASRRGQLLQRQLEKKLCLRRGGFPTSTIARSFSLSMQNNQGPYVCLTFFKVGQLIQGKVVGIYNASIMILKAFPERALQPSNKIKAFNAFVSLFKARWSASVF